jgi:hypothetical protein
LKEFEIVGAWFGVVRCGFKTEGSSAALCVLEWKVYGTYKIMVLGEFLLVNLWSIFWNRGSWVAAIGEEKPKAHTLKCMPL